jgi:quinol monooxygenase YgiN
MAKKPPPSSPASAPRAIGARATGAAATGATAIGASAIGSIAIGALALGAAAIGALAIGRLKIGRARLGRVDIGTLKVDRLEIGGHPAQPFTTLIRIRAAPGKGEAVEQLLHEPGLLDPAPGGIMAPAVTLHRSPHDPDLFLIQHHYADQSAFDPAAHTQRMHDIRHRLATENLVEGPPADAVQDDVFQRIAPEAPKPQIQDG